MRPVMVGICGGSGSGKTTIGRAIAGALPGQTLILEQDHYYRDHSPLRAGSRAKLNFDQPGAFDASLLVQQLRKLRSGEAIERPCYDFRTHARLSRTIPLKPKRAILLEGILVLHGAKIRELLDLKVFVETAADVRFIRRMLRDVRERGRSAESVAEQYLKTVRPMHDQFIEPQRRYADIVVCGDGDNVAALNALLRKIRALISAREAPRAH